MDEPANGDTSDHMAEIERILADDPNASAHYACVELHHGRIAWLAHHIRICDHRIDPIVARKLLSMIERTEPSCYFELALVRRQDIPSAKKDPVLNLYRAADMALEVARLGGFKRAQLQKAVKIVADRYGLQPSYVAKQVAPLKPMAVAAIEEEIIQGLYVEGKSDILGGPICPQTGFADKQSSE
jgi:hypothetical protein